MSHAQVINYEGHVHVNCGDIRFRAPEVVLGKHYGFKADSWSFGIIVYQLLTGSFPFDYKEPQRNRNNMDSPLPKT